MSDKSIELNRRRVLGGILTVGGAAAAAGAGTTALFFSEQTANNTIRAGSLTLDPVSGSFSITGLMPGEQTAQQSLMSSYSGESGVEFDLDIALSNVSGDGGNRTGTELAQQLNLDVAELHIGGTLVQDFTGSNTTLADLAGNNDAIATVADGDSIQFDLQVTLDSTVNNSYQDEGVNVDVTFVAEQASRD